MTGSLQRQLSSNTEKTNQSKDIDGQNIIIDDKPTTDVFVSKRRYFISEADSGTEAEDIEQQLEQLALSNEINSNGQLSVQSTSPIPDEGYSEYERDEDLQLAKIENDLQLANTILDETKKDFCQDTIVAFHGEFARLISIPLSLWYKSCFFLFSEEEVGDENLANLPVQYIKIDNAKAQFKCPCCQRTWTSMRARIAFSITNPQIGFIVLKIFGQHCITCGTYTDGLWYIDEVCRVMKNLAGYLFEQWYPDMLNKVDLQIQTVNQSNSRTTHHSNHDPTQRQGKMFAPHQKEFCEACQRGLCFN